MEAFFKYQMPIGEKPVLKLWRKPYMTSPSMLDKAVCGLSICSSEFGRFEPTTDLKRYFLPKACQLCCTENCPRRDEDSVIPKSLINASDTQPSHQTFAEGPLPVFLSDVH
jgi:hypothetical protein